MPQGDKSSYTGKQKRQAAHIEAGYEQRGASVRTAEARTWATVDTPKTLCLGIISTNPPHQQDAETGAHLAVLDSLLQLVCQLGGRLPCACLINAKNELFTTS